MLAIAQHLPDLLSLSPLIPHILTSYPRQTFDATRRPTSPSQDDDDDDFDADLTTDTIVLDPELAKAAKAAKARAASRASSATPFDGPEDKVTISVTWQPHPKDPQGRPEAFNFEVERVSSVSNGPPAAW